jgi:hypothetical protein
MSKYEALQQAVEQRHREIIAYKALVADVVRQLFFAFKEVLETPRGVKIASLDSGNPPPPQELDARPDTRHIRLASGGWAWTDLIIHIHPRRPDERELQIPIGLRQRPDRWEVTLFQIRPISLRLSLSPSREELKAVAERAVEAWLEDLQHGHQRWLSGEEDATRLVDYEI